MKYRNVHRSEMPMKWKQLALYVSLLLFLLLLSRSNQLNCE